jgi:hypothetical protein
MLRRLPDLVLFTKVFTYFNFTDYGLTSCASQYTVFVHVINYVRTTGPVHTRTCSQKVNFFFFFYHTRYMCTGTLLFTSLC